MLNERKKLPVFITIIACRGNCVTGNLCRTSLCPSLACKMDTSVLKSKRTQIQLTWGSLIGPMLISRDKRISETIQSTEQVIMYMWKGNRGKISTLGGVEGGKTFIGFPVQRSLTCLSQVGILPVNLVCSSTVFIYFMNLTVLCLPKVIAGWDSMRLLKRCTWHPDQPCDPNPFVSFWRLIRWGFTDSILAFISFSGITEIGDCIWKSWFIHFLEGTLPQFALRSLKCETCLRSVLCYSVSQRYPVIVNPYVSDKGKTLLGIPASSFVNTLH